MLISQCILKKNFVTFKKSDFYNFLQLKFRGNCHQQTSQSSLSRFIQLEKLSFNAQKNFQFFVTSWSSKTMLIHLTSQEQIVYSAWEHTKPHHTNAFIKQFSFLNFSSFVHFSKFIEDIGEETKGHFKIELDTIWNRERKFDELQ